MKGDRAKALKAAVEEVEEQEDEHLYHSTGWARELWIRVSRLAGGPSSAGGKKDVKTAIGAARAKQARGHMVHD